MLTNDNLLHCYEYIKKFPDSTCLLYNSIDIRQAGFKISPVDNNIFPAGFNNILPESIETFSTRLEKFFKEKSINTVLLITEDHTRNEGYFRNVMRILSAIKKACTTVDVATFSLDAHETKCDGETINVSKLEIFEEGVGTNKIPKPDLIILNNDLSGQMHESEKISAMLKMKNVIPSPKKGWNFRKKSFHFKAYEQLAKEVASNIGFDHWLINAEFTTATCNDFNSHTELQNLADAASDIFNKIRSKYKEYKISQTPAIFLKSESGTYGLGVEKVNSPEDLLNPNRTFRKKILYNKSKIANTEFLLQEGVPTEVMMEGSTAECTIYTTFGKAFGGFYRMHKEKNSMDNLNSKGAEFAPLTLEKDPSILNFIATLSSIAVSMEEYSENC